LIIISAFAYFAFDRNLDVQPSQKPCLTSALGNTILCFPCDASNAMQTIFHDAMKQVMYEKPEDPLKHLADLFQSKVANRDGTGGSEQAP
jgi:hypothetical protein